MKRHGMHTVAEVEKVLSTQKLPPTISFEVTERGGIWITAVARGETEARGPAYKLKGQGHGAIISAALEAMVELEKVLLKETAESNARAEELLKFVK